MSVKDMGNYRIEPIEGIHYRIPSISTPRPENSETERKLAEFVLQIPEYYGVGNSSSTRERVPRRAGEQLKLKLSMNLPFNYIWPTIAKKMRLEDMGQSDSSKHWNWGLEYHMDDGTILMPGLNEKLGEFISRSDFKLNQALRLVLSKNDSHGTSRATALASPAEASMLSESFKDDWLGSNLDSKPASVGFRKYGREESQVILGGGASGSQLSRVESQPQGTPVVPVDDSIIKNKGEISKAKDLIGNKISDAPENPAPAAMSGQPVSSSSAAAPFSTSSSAAIPTVSAAVPSASPVFLPSSSVPDWSAVAPWNPQDVASSPAVLPVTPGLPTASHSQASRRGSSPSRLLGLSSQAEMPAFLSHQGGVLASSSQAEMPASSSHQGGVPASSSQAGIPSIQIIGCSPLLTSKLSSSQSPVGMIRNAHTPNFEASTGSAQLPSAFDTMASNSVASKKSDSVADKEKSVANAQISASPVASKQRCSHTNLRSELSSQRNMQAAGNHGVDEKNVSVEQGMRASGDQNTGKPVVKPEPNDDGEALAVSAILNTPSQNAPSQKSDTGTIGAIKDIVPAETSRKDPRPTFKCTIPGCKDKFAITKGYTTQAGLCKHIANKHGDVAKGSDAGAVFAHSEEEEVRKGPAKGWKILGYLVDNKKKTPKKNTDRVNTNIRMNAFSGNNNMNGNNMNGMNSISGSTNGASSSANSNGIHVKMEPGVEETDDEVLAADYKIQWKIDNPKRTKSFTSWSANITSSLKDEAAAPAYKQLYEEIMPSMKRKLEQKKQDLMEQNREAMQAAAARGRKRKAIERTLLQDGSGSAKKRKLAQDIRGMTSEQVAKAFIESDQVELQNLAAKVKQTYISGKDLFDWANSRSNLVFNDVINEVIGSTPSLREILLKAIVEADLETDLQTGGGTIPETQQQQIEHRKRDALLASSIVSVEEYLQKEPQSRKSLMSVASILHCKLALLALDTSAVLISVSPKNKQLPEMVKLGRISAGKTTVIGRGNMTNPDADVLLTCEIPDLTAQISRRQAEIYFGYTDETKLRGNWYIRDCSTFGTWLEGKRMTRNTTVMLRDGNIICFGGLHGDPTLSAGDVFVKHFSFKFKVL